MLKKLLIFVGSIGVLFSVAAQASIGAVCSPTTYSYMCVGNSSGDNVGWITPEYFNSNKCQSISGLVCWPSHNCPDDKQSVVNGVKGSTLLGDCQNRVGGNDIVFQQ